MSYSRGRVTPRPTSVWLLSHLIYEHEFSLSYWQTYTLSIPNESDNQNSTYTQILTRQQLVTADTGSFWKTNLCNLQKPFSDCVCGYVPVKQFCLISSSHFKQILVIDLEMWANCPEITPFHLPKSKAGYVIDTLYSFIWDLTLWLQSSSYVLRKHLVRQYWHFSQGREIGVPWQLECFQDNVTLKTGSYRLYRN